ncbi:hypothetical protein BUE76_20360 [Cnuella takakiae]|nr:hypothetical protein BUE76_20360 [Cnuella takakiae]
MQAQEDTISAERPSESQSPNLVSKGYLQFEAGIRKEGSGHDYILFHPRSTVRYGLSKKLELRLELDAADEKTYSKQEAAYGLQPIQVGFKTPLLEENAWVPKTTLLVMAGIPTLAAHAYQVPHVFPLVRLLMENKLTDNLELDYNAGTEWDGESTNPRWMFSIEPQLNVGRHWQVFVEAYGRWQQGHGAEHVIDAGLGYYISRNVKLDLIAGKGLSHEAPDYFMATGISFRFRP